MTDKLRVGLIGAGHIARAGHLPALKRHSGVAVTAVADISEERAREVARMFDIPRVYASYDAMLGDGDLDAVIVATNNVSHAPITLAALAAGVDVLCEKPMATTVADAERMVAAARAAGRILMVGMTNRYRSDVETLRSLVSGGDVGELYWGRARIMRRRGTPTGWFRDSSLSGGGTLFDIGVHALDLCWWLMGQPRPVSVVGFTRQGVGEFSTKNVQPWQGYMPGEKFDVEDIATALVRFEGNRALALEVAWAQNGPQDSALRVDVLGTRAGATLDPLRLYREEEGIVVEVAPQVERGGDPFDRELAEFVDAVRQRRAPLSDGEQGLVVMRMLAGIYESARTGREVRLDG